MFAGLRCGSREYTFIPRAYAFFARELSLSGPWSGTYGSHLVVWPVADKLACTRLAWRPHLPFPANYRIVLGYEQ